MNAKKYLEQVKMLKTKIYAKQEEIRDINLMLYKITPDLNPNKVQSSGNQDKLGDGVLKLYELEKQLDKMLNKYVEKLKDVNDSLDKLKEPKEFDVLHRHYVLDVPWTEIAKEWGCTNVWVHKIKKDAYASLQEILNEKH